MATTLLDIFLVYVNFNKSINGLYFSFYIHHAWKNFKRLTINNYVINQMFKLQVFVV